MTEDSSVATLPRNDKEESVIAEAAVISTERRNLMPLEHHYYVYLMTNWNNKVVYVGITNNLERRVYEHKQKLVKGFTEKYKVNKLVYFEETGDVWAALAREKEIKKWRREKKNNLVQSLNPRWIDLSEGWFKISRCARNDKEESVLYDGMKRVRHDSRRSA